MATSRWSSKTMRIRSGWLRGSIYWVLLFRDCFAATKPLSQIQRSTLWPLQDATKRPPSVDSGLGEDGSESAPRLEQNLPELPPTRRIEPYRQGTSWVTGSWRVSSVEAFLAKSVKEPGILLILREPVRGSGSREIQLSGAAAATAAATPDGRLVFVHEPGTDELSWHVFSAETGARVNRLPFDAGTEAVAVVNGRVLYVVVEDIGTKHRRSLRCRDLHTAEAKWSHLLSEEVRKAPPPLRP